jgi:TRAP-type uncharacterized transport system substrate-binding protein
MSGTVVRKSSESADIRRNTQPQEPTVERSITLNFLGDWGQANFHRILGWLTQEFCDRSGPRSRVRIWSVRGGGIEALHAVNDGEVQLSIATPAQLLRGTLEGGGMFSHAMPDLRALAVLPQNDRMVFAIDPKFGVKTFEDLRQKQLPLRIATSTNDGTNFIGYVAAKFMEAHGISEEILKSWGGSYITKHRPEQTLIPALEGKFDAVLQEAIMTPWWVDLIEKRGMVPLPAEAEALELVSKELGLGSNPLPAGFWKTLDHAMPALDFSDFVVLVRDDLPEDVAYLLTWCLVETRMTIEKQYHHLPPQRSPLSYPLIPEKMAKPPLPLHPGAKRYYQEAGLLGMD